MGTATPRLYMKYGGSPIGTTWQDGFAGNENKKGDPVYPEPPFEKVYKTMV
jgi:hypothetical protein